MKSERYPLGRRNTLMSAWTVSVSSASVALLSVLPALAQTPPPTATATAASTSVTRAPTSPLPGSAQPEPQPADQQAAFPSDPGLPQQTPGIGSIPTSQPQPTAAVQSDPNPEVTEAVPPDSLLGIGLAPHHYDAVGYPESYEGLLIVEMDPQAGPITMVQGLQPHYLEAQFVNTQRDAVWLARKAAIVDVLPNGASYEIPYGYGAVKRSLSAVTLVEAQLQPHFSDNQKSYEVFPLEDLYLGATLSLVGLRGELRYVEKERYVGFGQVGLNLGGLAGMEFNRTYGAFAVPLVLGGGIRYPSLFDFVGTNWTTGAELILGLGSIDEDPDTANAIALPGLFHEVEWTFQRDIDVVDYRTDPRPYNYGVQSLYAKIGGYADFLGGATKSLLLDVHVGYRYNFQGPKIPRHQFKETKITYASERYVQRKLEEEKRRQELEELRRRREQQDPNTAQPYPAYPPPGTTTAPTQGQNYPPPAAVQPGQVPSVPGAVPAPSTPYPQLPQNQAPAQQQPYPPR